MMVGLSFGFSFKLMSFFKMWQWGKCRITNKTEEFFIFTQNTEYFTKSINSPSFSALLLCYLAVEVTINMLGL